MAAGLALAAPTIHDGSQSLTAWCGVIVLYAVYRTLRPLEYHDDLTSLLAVLGEVAVHVIAVDATGSWGSPLVFSLVSAVIVAGFSRGFGFALQIGLVSAVSVGVPDLVRDDGDFVRVLRWTVQLLVVAVVAGYARRISGEADQQHTIALDRLGRLADANALLFSLHRVAQTLPASLDFDEALDSTLSRLHDLFDFDAVAILIHDETDETWLVARCDGARLPAKIPIDQLPPPLVRVDTAGIVHEPDLEAVGSRSLAPNMSSGLYAVLSARRAVTGLVALEHRERGHFSSRDVDMLRGFTEPVALAIDNARWFSRLRTVGAEEERTRIARDLHDRIGQSLAYLAFELDRIVKSGAKGADVTSALDQLRSAVRGVVGEVRDTLYDLRTDVSETQDIVTVLHAFLARVRERANLEIALDVEQTGRLPLVQEREMLRIAQEAVVNVEHHAHATTLRINWACDGRGAALEVTDDGSGFAGDVGESGRPDSYGILGMRERAASIGATLDIESSPDQGTKVTCTVGERRSRPAPFLVGEASAS